MKSRSSDANENFISNSEGSRLSAQLAMLKELCREKDVTFGQIIENMTVREHALLTLILSIPFLFPIPVPGLSVVFGLIVAFAGAAAALGRKPWLPEKISKKSVSVKILQKIFDWGSRICKYLEKIGKPRGVFLFRYSLVQRLNGILIAICGLLLALPLPPGTNFPPAIAIFLLSVGGIEEDVVFILLGYFAFIFNLFFFGELWLFGMKGIKTFLSLLV